MVEKRAGEMDDDYPEIREAVRALCGGFPGEYWRAKDRDDAYPSEFVRALTDAGYLAALIPEDYGGSGLGLSAACAILEEIQHAGCNAAACHAQMYVIVKLPPERTVRYAPRVLEQGDGLVDNLREFHPESSFSTWAVKAGNGAEDNSARTMRFGVLRQYSLGRLFHHPPSLRDR